MNRSLVIEIVAFLSYESRILPLLLIIIFVIIVMVLPGTAFVDNQPTLDLLEAKAVGIFSMIDEEINVPRGSDEGFLQKVLTKYADGKHPNCLRPNVRDVKDFLKNFGILHYAGPVFYNVGNFLEKNKDQLHTDIIGLLRESSSPFIKKMFPPEENKSIAGKGTKLKTLGGQFKTQLTDLIDTLNTTFPHFVRCLKPNDEKLPNLFHAGRMQDQLRYAGLLEVCRIRKLGLPVRRPFEEFYRRYRCCDLTSPDLDSLLAALLRKGVLIRGEYAKGISRVFMRTAQAQDLELARESALLQVAVLLQRMGRGMVCRLKYKNFKKILINVAEAIRRREESVLASALEMSFELPWGGGHLYIIQQAKALLARVREENKVIGLLQSAIAAKELNSLKSAVAAANSMHPPFQVQKSYPHSFSHKYKYTISTPLTVWSNLYVYVFPSSYSLLYISSFSATSSSRLKPSSSVSRQSWPPRMP